MRWRRAVTAAGLTLGTLAGVAACSVAADHATRGVVDVNALDLADQPEPGAADSTLIDPTSPPVGTTIPPPDHAGPDPDQPVWIDIDGDGDADFVRWGDSILNVDEATPWWAWAVETFVAPAAGAVLPVVASAWLAVRGAHRKTLQAIKETNP